MTYKALVAEARTVEITAGNDVGSTLVAPCTTFAADATSALAGPQAGDRQLSIAITKMLLEAQTTAQVCQLGVVPQDSDWVSLAGDEDDVTAIARTDGLS